MTGLTDTRIRQTKPGSKRIKLPDNGGLYLVVFPTGSRSWRWRYMRKGVERVVTLGTYPDMGLAAARRARDAAQDAVVAGHDPAEPEPPPPPVRTFEDEALAWHESTQRLWKPHHAQDVLASLREEVFPDLGKVPVGESKAPAVLAVLQRVAERGAAERAHRLRQRISAIMDRAVALGYADGNPVTSLRRQLAPVIPIGRRAAVATLEEARAVLRAAEAVPAHPVTRLALRLLALTAVRPGDIRGATWGEFGDLTAADPVWTIPAARMKVKTERAGETPDHVVPLAPQAVDALLAVRTLTGEGPIPFPNWSNPRKPLSENAIGYLLNRAGYHGHQTAHGWRATFSSVMNERRPVDRAVIDLMLAHVIKDQVERAYNRAQHMTRRREIAAEWAGLLMEGMPPAAELLKLPRK